MYDNYLGLDWAQRNMAIARMTRHSNEVKTVDVKSDIEDLKVYLQQLGGKIILTFEETNPAQWLYTELKDYVDTILVCDPYRNHLLKEGGKTDRVDASKLVRLLKAGLLKEVFHCSDDFIYLRKLVSGYDDLIQMGVRQKNQKSALFRASGKSVDDQLKESSELFVLEGLESGIKHYEDQKKRYQKRFEQVTRDYKIVRDLASIPGMGTIGSIVTATSVIDAKRFKTKQNFWSYCGLIRHDLMSGGRSYGKRSPRCSKRLKNVFKTAAVACIAHQKDTNPLYVYYKGLLTIKGYPEYQARNALARRIATLALGVMKSKKSLNKKELFKKETKAES